MALSMNLLILILWIGHHYNGAKAQSYNCDFDPNCDWIEENTSSSSQDTELVEQVNANNYTSGNYVVLEWLTSGRSSYLRSPWVISTTHPWCTLSVHTFSVHPGSCRLKLFRSEIWDSTGSKLLQWSYTDIIPGDNRWERASWELGHKTEPFFFILKPESESGQNCSMAVDNVTMTDCQPDYLPANHYCTFDEKSTCGWHAGPYSDHSNLTWLMNRGPTPSKNTGPPADHTSKTDQGYYMYIEADTKVPKGKNPHAQLDSRLFLPPPEESQNHSGWKDGMHDLCQVTFAYHKFGFDAYKLSLSAVFPCSDREPKDLWIDNMWKNNDWKMQRVSLTEINEPLRFTAAKSLNDGHLADFALDDIALSPACFGTVISTTRQYYADYDKYLTSQDSADNLKEQCRLLRDMLNHIIEPAYADATETVVDEPGANTSTYKFNSCGALGMRGPTESMCDKLYTYSLNKVRVTNGIQTWTVPQTGQYSITALGASGGSGAKSVGESNGAYVHGKFNLSKGQKIHILVGQKGWNSCSQIGFGDVNEICKGEDSSENGTYRAISGGGGGGGGATYVFVGELGSDNLTPLLIAGGGGGLGYNMTRSDAMVMGGWNPDHGSGKSGYSYSSGAGGGGGWYGHADGSLYSQAGQAILNSARPGQGGVACPAAKQQGWYSSGGFGGGGGGCFTGGGGGGYTGGNSSHENDVLGFINGKGGTSYIDPKAEDAAMEQGIHQGHGTVEFHLSVSCPCSYLCVVNDVKKKLYECHCPINKTLAKDGHTCVAIADSSLDVGHIIIVCTGVLLILILLISVTYIVQFRRRKHARKTPRDILPPVSLTSDPTDHSQNPRPLGRRTEVNMYYDFVGTDTVTQDLTQIPRDNLRLIRPLGQGAFGEVYEGILTNFGQDKCNMSVAVKTLPAISTDQAKLDFLMEAIIISKFQHPNIVQFIGICMDKHPGFIVLELLEGGDLKTFLRESRRKADVPCPLTVADLLRLALDIANGCKHLEQDHFIHRDIAARNCLLTSKGSGRVAKIADFGMARDIYRADYYKKGGRAMLPVKWMPPEAFMDGIFTSKTDVWSFGVLLWEVFSMGLMPYPGRSNQDVMEFVTGGGRMDPPDKCPPPVYDIMMSCWHVLPERRPFFPALIKRLLSCLQNDEILRAPLPCNPLGLRSGHNCSHGTVSPSLSSTAPLLSPQTPEVTPDTYGQQQARAQSKVREHRTAFNKLHPQGYRPVPLQDFSEPTFKPADRGRLSFDFTTKYNMVALIPSVVGGSSPNIVTSTDLSELNDPSETSRASQETSLLNPADSGQC